MVKLLLKVVAILTPLTMPSTALLTTYSSALGIITILIFCQSEWQKNSISFYANLQIPDD